MGMISELETDRVRNLIRDIIRTLKIVNQLGITELLKFSFAALYRQKSEEATVNFSKYRFFLKIANVYTAVL